MVKADNIKGLKGKKKKWFPILAPEMFNNALVGETIQYEAEEAMGRYVVINLMSLTHDMKSQNVNVKFVITGTRDGSMHTKIEGYEIVSASIKRVVRRRHTRIDDSLGLKTKDGVRVRIKPLVLTRGEVKSSVEGLLRAKLRQLVYKFVTENDYETVFRDVVFNKFQKMVRETLSKVYPVKESEIRVLEKETKSKAEKAELKEKSGLSVAPLITEEPQGEPSEEDEEVQTYKETAPAAAEETPEEQAEAAPVEAAPEAEKAKKPRKTTKKKAKEDE